MKPASGLTLVALGAILAFAVTGHPWFLNLQVAGWVIMLTGVAGMLIPRRGYGWLRRRIVLRRGPGGRPVIKHAEEQRYPPYVILNPAATVAGEPAGTAASGTGASGTAPTASEPPARPDLPSDEAGAARPDGGQPDAERPSAEWAVTERAVADWQAAEEAAAPGEPRPAEEVVEEYVEE